VQYVWQLFSTLQQAHALLLPVCRLHDISLAAFYQLKTPVEKSDAWRYHVLCGHGGIYTDTDTVCGRPFSEWTNFNSTPEPGLIVGVENRFYSQEVRGWSAPALFRLLACLLAG
jgi:hypothetical protein